MTLRDAAERRITLPSAPSMKPPDPEELTPAQEAELLGALHALRDRLSATLSGSDATDVVELDQTKMGRVSRVDAMQQQQMALASRRQAEIRLSQVKTAIERHAEAEYGWCRSCEEPIGYKRLRARPEALFCLNCQSATER